MRAIYLILCVVLVGCDGERPSTQVCVLGDRFSPHFVFDATTHDGHVIHDGLQVSFYPSGQVEEIRSYKDNRLDGPSWSFTSTGAPFSAGSYSKGQSTGIWRLWGANGRYHDENHGVPK